MTQRLTKQGVRDLNDIPTKPRGIRLPMPPSQKRSCNHRNKEGYSTVRVREVGTNLSGMGRSYCQQCG